VSERKGQAGGPKGGQAKAGAKKEAPKAAAPKAAAPKAAAPKAEGTGVTAAREAAQAQKTADAAAHAEERRAFKRTLVGRVKSDKMDKTVVVEVVRSKMDPVYKKYVRVRKSYKAHDEENAYRIGDRVEIVEHRPLSKLKRWKVINLVERAVQE
jgi:small subunit ribosomal protein S17